MPSSQVFTDKGSSRTIVLGRCLRSCADTARQSTLGPMLTSEQEYAATAHMYPMQEDMQEESFG